MNVTKVVNCPFLKRQHVRFVDYLIDILQVKFQRNISLFRTYCYRCFSSYIITLKCSILELDFYRFFNSLGVDSIIVSDFVTWMRWRIQCNVKRMRQLYSDFFIKIHLHRYCTCRYFCIGIDYEVLFWSIEYYEIFIEWGICLFICF